jgi:hypothetical protein
MAKASKDRSNTGVFTTSNKERYPQDNVYRKDTLSNKREGDSARPGRIEIQRGPVDMDQQFTQGFRVRSDTTVRDMDDLVERRWGQTMIEDTPKR